MATPSLPPDDSLLRRFLAGNLTGAEFEQVAEYLDRHPEFVTTFYSLKVDDTLLAALKNADSHTDDSPAMAALIEKFAELSQVDSPGTPQPSEFGQATVTAPAPVDPQHAPTAAPDEGTNPFDEDIRGMLASAERSDEIGRLGRYRVLRVLGRGGMGVVFAAEDDRLKRNVALKVMLPRLAVSSTARQRFVREAETAAKVEHDNIVPIYDIAEDHGIPFIALPLLVGETLDNRLRGHEPLATADILIIGKQIAEGLGAAHAAGLIHRDIKPSNVWLERTASGVFRRARILDFGLARPTREGGEQLTHTGAIMGTPAYMAPEQARGIALDHRADLFSLGCVLYQMATGQRPFRGDDTFAILTALAVDHPPAPIELNPHCPPALSALITGLLVKDPAVRWPTRAQEVADELIRIAANPALPAGSITHIAASAPVPMVMVAPPAAPRPEDVWSEVADDATEADTTTATEATGTPTAVPARPARRRQGGYGPMWLAIGILIGGLALGAVKYGAQIIRIMTNEGELVVEVDDENIEVTVKKDGVVITDKSKKREYVLKAGKGEVVFHDPDGPVAVTKTFEIKRGDTVVVKASMADVVAARPKPKDVKQKDPKQLEPVEATIRGLFDGDHFEVQKADGGIAVSPNGKLLAVTTGTNNEVWVFDTATRKAMQKLPGHKDRPFRVAFSPDNKLVASAGLDGKIFVWEVESGKLRHEFTHGDEYVVSVAFRPDGKQLASGGQTTVKLWNLETGKEEKEFDGHDDDVHGLAYSADGNWLASGAQDNVVKLWNLKTGAVEKTFDKLPGKGCGISFSPDNKLLAFGAGAGSDAETYLRVWSIAEKKMVISTRDIHGAWTAFAQDSKSLWVGPWQTEGAGLVQRIGLDGKSLAKFTYPELDGAYVGLALSSDGSTLYIADHDHGVVACDTATGKPRTKSEAPSPAHPDELFNGKDLTGWVSDGFGLWSVENGVLVGKQQQGWLMTEAEFGDFELTLEYRLSTSGDGDGGLGLRLAPNGACLELQLLDDTRAKNGEFKPDEVTGALYQVAAPLATPKAPAGQWNAVRMRFVGSRLTAEINGTKTLDLDLRDAKYRDLALVKAAYRDTGRIALQAGDSKTEYRNIRVAAVGGVALTRRPLEEDEPGRVGRLLFTDNKTLLEYGNDNQLITWDRQTGRPTRTQPLATPDMLRCAPSPDRKFLAVYRTDRTVEVREADSGKVLAQLGKAADYRDAVFVFSPDGTRLALTHDDMRVRVWNWATKKIVLETDPFPSGAEELANQAAHVAFSPDGYRLVVAGHFTQEVHIYDLKTQKLETKWTIPVDENLLLDDSDKVTALAISPDGTMLATGHRRVTLWEFPTSKQIATLAAPAGEFYLYGLAFSSDAKRIAIGCHSKGTVMVFDVGTRKALFGLSGVKPRACVVFSPDGTVLAAAGDSSPVRFFDGITGRAISAAKLPAGSDNQIEPKK